MGFLLRTAITALALWVAAEIVPGILVTGTGTLILAALLLGLVNATVRPVAFVLSLPLTVLTLGLFLLVLNAAMLGLVALLLPGMMVAGLGSAILGALVVSVVSWFVNRALLGDGAGRG